MTGPFMEFLVSGTVLGLSAGLSPGPLLALVVTETLKYDAREGMKVAVSPLITDAPIVALAVAVLSRLSDHSIWIGMISLTGAIFIAYLGYESFVFSGADLPPLDVVRVGSLKKGIIANFLNPGPYLFWMSVGAPLIIKAWRADPSTAAAFVFIFYAFLIGSKIFVALAVARSRSFLKSSHYILAIRFLGLTLFVFALFFLKSAYIHLKPS